MLITIVVTLIVIGLLLWLVNQLPLDAKISQLLNATVIVVVVLWLLKMVLGAGGIKLP